MSRILAIIAVFVINALFVLAGLDSVFMMVCHFQPVWLALFIYACGGLWATHSVPPPFGARFAFPRLFIYPAAPLWQFVLTIVLWPLPVFFGSKSTRDRMAGLENGEKS